MKYIHLTQWSPRNSFGGYETIVRDAAEAQHRRGHTAYVVGRSERSAKGIHTHRIRGVTYIEVSFSMKRGPGTLAVGPAGYLRLFLEILVSVYLLTPVVVRLLRRERIDAVLFYGIHLMMMGPLVRLFGGKAFLGLEVLQKNQNVPVTSFLYWFRRLKYACFNGIFTYTHYFWADGRTYNNIALLRRYAPRVPIALIPWGIDVTAISRVTPDPSLLSWKMKHKAQVVICPRRVVEEKGVRYLLEAVPHILRKFPSVRVVFAGDGMLRPQLERRAKELGVTGHVRFTGFLPREKTLGMIKASDVMVVPSSGEESFGMVFLEAYALGTPIVSTWFGGISNVVENGKSGTLVEPKNAGVLASAVVSVLSNSSKRRRYVEEGKIRVRGEFTLDMTLTRLDRFCQSV